MSHSDERAWQPVHAPLAEQARSRPDARFLLAGEGLSYAAAANWVAGVAAGHLQRFAGERVALWLDKGNGYALGILAALHAGCTYVPIDGAQPAQRVGIILDDAAPAAVIADHSHACALLAQGLPQSVKLLMLLSDMPLPDAPAGLEVVSLGGRLDAAPAAELPECAAVRPDQIGAILYTSGSTGTPKGVQLSHMNLANFVRWCVQELTLSPDDRLLNLASFNFDLSTFDLFASLQAGAALYVTSERETAQVSSIADLLRAQAITVIYSVPSLFALLNRIGAWTALPHGVLRCVVFAGEVMPKPQLQAMAAALPPSCRFYNLYGPTETNVCLYHRVGDDDLGSDGPLPIGVPISGAIVWLVDDQGRLVSGDGVIGEVWASGRCVTPGYWNRKDPKNSLNHARGMHATGDYGEWRDGRLLYRGRKDRMLKLSGYRVELGEIESALARHPQIHEAAVVADSVSPPRLLAFYATRDPQQRLGSLELKAFCAQHLPKYMVPHVLTQQAGLPKNANGKIDYRALREGAAQPEAA
ncbi:L-prolyl-AMP ligase [Burkholderiaceae bacterium]|nr:L-prolyl-AMP ligase [Burkholderiaceae bacterium]